MATPVVGAYQFPNPASAPPNIERTGVVAGFTLYGAGLNILSLPDNADPFLGYIPPFGTSSYPTTIGITPGVLFAQGVMYAPVWAGVGTVLLPRTPTATSGTRQQYWLYYNSVSGFYYTATPAATTAGDAFIGWIVVDNHGGVVLTSTQQIAIQTSGSAYVDVVPIGPVAQQGPGVGGGGTYGDAGVPIQLSWEAVINNRGQIQFSIPFTFTGAANVASVSSITFNVVYRDETAAAVDSLTAAVTAVATVFPVVNGAHFTVGNLYLIDQELVLATAIAGNNVTMTRAQCSTIAEPHFGPMNVTGATNAAPIVVTVVGHGRPNGDVAYLAGALGNTAANGGWGVQNQTANTFELAGSIGNGAWTSGGVLAGSQVYAATSRVAVFAVNAQLFSAPAAGNWSGVMNLASATIVAIGGLWTNFFGPSVVNWLNAIGVAAGNLVTLRSLFGYVIELTVDGMLGIESDACPEVMVPYNASVSDVRDYVQVAPVGGAITAVVTRNGVDWATVTIADGSLAYASPLNGLALAPLVAGDKLGLDVTGVGLTSPGTRLTVRIVL